MRHDRLALLACVAMLAAGCPTPSGTDTTSSSSSSGGQAGGSSSSSSGSTSNGGSGSSGANGSGSTSGGSSSGDASSGVSGGTASSSSTSSGGGGSSSSSSGGGTSSGEPGGTITECGRTITPPAQGTCTVTPGDGNILLEGTVLTETESLHGGQVLVNAAGNIVCAACDCEGEAQAAGATRISCANGVISPGLINSHDHLTFDQLSPYAPSGALADERYEHRHDWRRGSRGHTRIASPSGGNNATRAGEMRNLLGGATSINGSGAVDGLLRNLDRANNREGLTGAEVAYQTFPLGDSSGTLRTSDCSYGTLDRPDDTDIAAAGAYTPHVSEGIDAEARNEFLCLSSTMNGGQDLAMPKSAFIHGIGLNPIDLALMGAEGVGLIWSPRSNVSLYGHTAQVTLAHTLGVEIALGTDWTPTGSINLLRELACARELNERNYGAFFTDKQLWEMVTLRAARLMAVDTVLGALAPGKIADITVFTAGMGRTDWRAVITADSTDVALVLRGGKVMTGDADVVAALPDSTGCEVVDMCGTQKRVCAQRETGLAFSTIAQDGGYALFFCGTPTNEPSCVPSRPGDGMSPFNPPSGDNRAAFTAASMDDQDGDGVPDGMDNCPEIFNPARPLDGTMQGDADGDMVGDVCDVCPLDANAMTCSLPNPDDPDNDGRLNSEDNCPNDPNMDQLDFDTDGKGDVCDACPMASNPGNQPCPASVYAIKQGDVTGPVSVSNLIVTAVAPTGFFAQVDPDAGTPYMGVNHSGIFTYTGTNGAKPAVGDLITITSATAADFFGQKQLTNPTFTVEMPGVALPTAEVINDPALVATGGSRAGELESVLVRVENVTGGMMVTNAMPTPGAGESGMTYEFEVTGGLRVNDFLFRMDPQPLVGDVLTFVQGVVRFANENSKIEPRDEADIGTELRLVRLNPSEVFVAEQGTDITLMVELNREADMEIPVMLTSSDDTKLTVPMMVTVPVGASSAAVTIHGEAPARDLTITASYDGVMVTATAHVIGTTETPVLTEFTLDPDTVTLGGMTTGTLTLDFPPFMNTDVTLTGDANVMVPATATVMAGSRTGTFTATAGMTVGMGVINATLGSSMLDATLNITDVPQLGLIINEIDYDSTTSGEDQEFVELLNASSSEVSLQDLSVILYNGSSSPSPSYETVALSGTLAPGAYLVVATPGFNFTTTATVLRFTSANKFQNGPDGVAVINTASNTMVDGVAYEGAITISLGGSTVMLPELPSGVEDSPAAVSVARDISGPMPTWVKTSTPTPGEPNVLTP